MDDLLKNKKLLIFDCDGVLFDSHEANTEFFFTCLRQAGISSIPDEFTEKIRYLSLKQLVSEIFNDPAEADRVHGVSLTVDYAPFLDRLRPLFDFGRVFGTLTMRFHMAVASNRGRSLDQVIGHFGLDEYFHYRVSTVNALPKPDPDMLFKCLDHFNLAGDEAVFFGDSISDYEAAASAGVHYVWVGTGEEPRISSVSELAALSG